jgi:hypothetical protein
MSRNLGKIGRKQLAIRLVYLKGKQNAIWNIGSPFVMLAQKGGHILRLQDAVRTVKEICLMRSDRINGKLTYTQVHKKIF